MLFRRFRRLTWLKKPRRFENAPLLPAFSKRRGFNISLDRCRVNERCNRNNSDAVKNETTFVWTQPKNGCKTLLSWQVLESCPTMLCTDFEIILIWDAGRTDLATVARWLFWRIFTGGGYRLPRHDFGIAGMFLPFFFSFKKKKQIKNDAGYRADYHRG